MFAQQSRAQFAPMNMPPGSPRQTAGAAAGGAMGKGGGSSQVSTPGGGGKGGGGQPMRGRPFDNNPGNGLRQQQGSSMFAAAQNMFGGPQGFGGGGMLVGGPFISGGDPLQTMTGGPRPAGPIQAVAQPSQPPVLNEYGLPAAVQPPALNQYGLPMGTHPSQIAANPDPRPMAPTPPALNQYGLPMGMHPSQMPGLLAQLQGFGGF